MHTDAISWNDSGGVSLLDQTLLPEETTYLEIDTIEGMVEAISVLRVRGAPLIGIAAAMGLAAAANRALRENTLGTTSDEVLTWIAGRSEDLASARPTAVNLRWAMELVRSIVVREIGDSDSRPAERAVLLLREEAQRLWDEDSRMCRAIGEAGADVVPQDGTILTICNTGMLATGGIGTAFGVIKVAHERGLLSEVVACETRPLRQGSRLTAWELARAKIPGTVIVDSAAATVMSQGRIDMVVAGADRIAANGDSANKIGTHSLAILAKAHGIPFYIAAPRSTIDPNTASGADIPIEERAPGEIGMAPGVAGYNPAFDVTPASLITGIVTDIGILEAPYEPSIAAALKTDIHAPTI
jgi:methylthioribose-1-phosphate isomerase